MTVPHRLNALGIFDDRSNFEAVSNDAGIGQQPRNIIVAKCRNNVDINSKNW